MPKYNMHDILIGILNYVSEETTEFRHDIDSSQRFFYSRRPKYNVLKEIPFDTDGLSPASSEVESAYDSLYEARLLTSFGPDFNPHIISNALRISFGRYVKKRFSETELPELKRLAEDFQKEFSLETRIKTGKIKK
jgi:hypothetical protein